MINTDRVLSPRFITLAGLTLVVAAVAIATVLAWVVGRDTARLEAIKTGSTIAVGLGGLAALWLAARKQRTAELALQQTERDASERRITELYGKAAEQLGSDKPPVRLAGIYALERLAQANPEHQQTVVNLFCAYLRMPFDDSEAEFAVQRTLQALLRDHLRPDPPETYWPDMEVRLSRATLTEFSFTRCRVRVGRFHGTRFRAETMFRDAEFTTWADFTGSQFDGRVSFTRVVFPPGTSFEDAEFHGQVLLDGTQTRLAQ
ncbi:pentapeptide repeat-containing protein [Pseudonocardiaceae bacterium YIM PH 21723]|nr:pentapeptide repeat-containing protein [Pseudonocardiaceae bacterium YIM PH 21723]